MVVGVRSGIQDYIQRIEVALEIGGQNLDLSSRQFPTDGPYRLREMTRAAIGQFVAIHRRDYNIREIELGGRFRYLLGFVRKRLERTPSAGSHRAEAAASRADVTEDHEGGDAAAKALVAIWAASFFADGVQTASAEESLEVVIRDNVSLRLPEPLREPRSRLLGTTFELYEHRRKTPAQSVSLCRD
jgi:hypothetical protein